MNNLDEILDVIASIMKRSDDIFIKDIENLCKDFKTKYDEVVKKNNDTNKPNPITSEYINNIISNYQPFIEYINNVNKDLITSLGITFQYKNIEYYKDDRDMEFFDKNINKIMESINNINGILSIYNNITNDNLKHQIAILIKQCLVNYITYLTGFNHLVPTFISIKNNDRTKLEYDTIFKKCNINLEDYKTALSLLVLFDECLLGYKCINDNNIKIGVKELINKIQKNDAKDNMPEIIEFAIILNKQIGKLNEKIAQTINYFLS